MSLPHSPLTDEQQHSVVEVVRRELLTPYGLRSLARGDPNYKGRYTGNQMQRDAAYHNGTVWGWLIGPFLEAHLRVNRRSTESIRQAQRWLQPLLDHLEREACLGQISEIFEGDEESPFMLLVKRVRPQWLDKIPAIVHVDGTARVQTVHKETNQRFYNLLQAFRRRTGCAVLLNTSFNIRGEPIVCTPDDAFRCFMGTELDLLVVGNSMLRKEDQDPSLKWAYKDQFETD